jgi:hypothetical protein
MPIARGVATCSKQSKNLLHGYGRELLKIEEYRSNSQQREFSGMQKYTAAPQVQSEQNTVLAVQNQPLRPRAEGEMVWQPERRPFQAANLVKPLPAAVI